MPYALQCPAHDPGASRDALEAPHVPQYSGHADPPVFILEHAVDHFIVAPAKHIWQDPGACDGIGVQVGACRLQPLQQIWAGFAAQL